MVCIFIFHCVTVQAENTDPHDKPGQHWLAIWTQNGVCEDIKVLWSQTFGTINAKMKICRYLYRRATVVDIIAYSN